MMANVKEVKARGAYVLGLTTKEHTAIETETDFTFYIPKTCDMMLPSLVGCSFTAVRLLCGVYEGL